MSRLLMPGRKTLKFQLFHLQFAETQAGQLELFFIFTTLETNERKFAIFVQKGGSTICLKCVQGRGRRGHLLNLILKYVSRGKKNMDEHESHDHENCQEI